MEAGVVTSLRSGEESSHHICLERKADLYNTLDVNNGTCIKNVKCFA